MKFSFSEEQEELDRFSGVFRRKITYDRSPSFDGYGCGLGERAMAQGQY